MFINKPPQNRIEAFDDLIASADMVLRHPYVQEALGPLAVELATINDNAFLPNITGGVIRIPREQLNTDNVAVVPLMYNKVRHGLFSAATYERTDGSMFFDDSACQPTINMTNKVSERLRAAGWEYDEISDFLDRNSRPTYEYLHIGFPPSGGAAMDYVYTTDEESATRMTSRPIIITDFAPGLYSPLERGVIMGHEYVHALDAESACVMPHDLQNEAAVHEMHAYHMETEKWLALRAAGFGPYNADCEKKAFEVEYFRRQMNPWDDPYAVSPQITRGLDELGVFA